TRLSVESRPVSRVLVPRPRKRHPKSLSTKGLPSPMGRIAVSILVVVVAMGVLYPEPFASATDALLSTTLSSFGWLYLLVVTGLLLFMLYLAFGRHGSTRLGGP